MMDETRVNAALAELNAVIQMLLQRNVNLAGDLATALNKQKEEEIQDSNSGTSDSASGGASSSA